MKNKLKEKIMSMLTAGGGLTLSLQLLILNAFFRKKTIYKDASDKEYALKNDIPRLRKLLNLPKPQMSSESFL